jgi:hypothetical protein
MCTSDDQFLLPLPLTAQLEGMGIERSAIALKFDTQQMAAGRDDFASTGRSLSGAAAIAQSPSATLLHRIMARARLPTLRQLSHPSQHHRLPIHAQHLFQGHANFT